MSEDQNEVEAEILLNSPLNEVEAGELDALMTRDPEGLTLDETTSAVKLFVRRARAEREAWEKKDAEAHAKGKYGRGPKRDLPKDATSIYNLKD